MASPRYEWRRIHDEYVTAPEAISKQDLADKYGMARQTLATKATKEQWDVERGRFMARVREQTTEKKAELIVNEGAQWDASCMGTAKALLAAVNQTIMRGTRKNAEGKQEILLADAAILHLTSAAAKAQEMGKSALGDKPEANINVTGKLDLSIEEVIAKYADATGSPVPSENRTGE